MELPLAVLSNPDRRPLFRPAKPRPLGALFKGHQSAHRCYLAP